MKAISCSRNDFIVKKYFLTKIKDIFENRRNDFISIIYDYTNFIDNMDIK